MPGPERNLDRPWASIDVDGGAAASVARLRDNDNQTTVGLIAVYIGQSLAGVRLRRGDVVTTVQRVYLVGTGGDRFALAGPDVRVYRPAGRALTPSRPRRARASSPRPARRSPHRRAQPDGSPGVGSLDDFMAEAEGKLRQVTEAQQRFERTEVAGHSRNNGVTAKMRGTGQVTDVTIDPRILQRFDAKAIGGFVTEAVNDALRRLGDANRAIFAPLLAEADLEITTR